MDRNVLGGEKLPTLVEHYVILNPYVRYWICFSGTTRALHEISPFGRNDTAEGRIGLSFIYAMYQSAVSDRVRQVV